MRPRLSALLITGLVLAPLSALARPGGGHGYGGGGGGGDYSGGGGGGDSSGWETGDDGYEVSDRDAEALAGLVAFLLGHAVNLTRSYPLVMFPVWGGVALLLVFRHRLRPDTEEWTLDLSGAGGAPETSATAPLAAGRLPRAELERLRESDPAFSVVLFEDLAHSLFAKAHDARGAGALDTLGAYLSPAVRASLSRLSDGLSAVEGIVVGAMRYHAVSVPEDETEPVRVILEFEANYTEVPREGGPGEPRGLYSRERWTLRRSRTARSRPPERIRSFGCPSCAGPLSAATGPCPWCGVAVEPGERDWMVAVVDALEREPRAPALTGHAPERTPPDTVVDPRLEERRRELEARDPQFSGAAFHARVRHVFAQLQPAWSELDLARARPWLSDNLLGTWRYWFDAYRRAGLRNASENARVTGLRTARVSSDAYFDAVTVRLRATGLDYTLDARGQVVSGDREHPREYSEYWTLIRGRGARGAPRTDLACPRCAGPLAVSMAGVCESCGAHVTAGEFDWVLSRVEQDESYQG
jgi:predicted lipid-binding transport protein (Tim44 family)